MYHFTRKASRHESLRDRKSVQAYPIKERKVNPKPTGSLCYSTVMSRILFVSTPYHCGVVEVAGRWIPLQFCTLADAADRAGVEPVIYDAMSTMVTHEDIELVLKDMKPDYLGLSSITATLPDTLEVAAAAKRVSPGTRVILGGVHPSFCPEEIFQTSDAVDFIVAGEGEMTLHELLSSLEAETDPSSVPGLVFRSDGNIVKTTPRSFLEDLETYKARYDLLDWEPYKYFAIPGTRLGAISTSRGCSHNCIFCSQQKFWKQTWRPRDPQNVVKELEMLYSRYRVNVVLIGDEYPTSDRDRWIDLLERIRSLNHRDLYLLMETRVDDIVRDADILSLYREAGIVHVYVGVEATRQETLDYIKKDINVEMGREALRLLREHGFISETSFVLGFPDETAETIEATLELAHYYDPDFAHFLTITPWPYADLYNDVKDLIAVTDYRKYNLIDPILKPDAMTLDEVDLALVDCYRKFYARKFGAVMKEKDEFKRQYMIRSMQLIMKSSFIIDKLKRFPVWRARIEKMMKTWVS